MKSHTVVGTLKTVKIRNDSFLVNKNRNVRIWTPKSYKSDAKKPYDVIYMFDGNNLFDDATSFAGEWHIDEIITECEKGDHIRPSIVVGIDNSPDRLSEYLPRFSNIAIGDLGYKGQTTFDYLVNQVIPFVEEHYNVGKTRKYRSLGGSSMGGLMTFEGGLEYTCLFSRLYVFSSAFTIFKYGVDEEPPVFLGVGNNSAMKYVINEYSKPSMVNKFKLAFSTGGGEGYEGECYVNTHRIIRELKKAGWTDDNIYLYANPNMGHNESQWTEAFYYAYKFMNNKKSA